VVSPGWIAVPVFLLLVPIFIAFGDRLARQLGLRPGPLVERVSLSFVLAVGAVTLIVFGLAVAHALSPWTCMAVAAGMAAAGAGTVREGLRGLTSVPWRQGIWPAGRLDRLLTALIGAFLGGGLLLALAPPTGMDTGVYHFTIPKVILQSGGLIPREDVWIHKSGGFYMVYAFGMALGGEILAKLLGYAMAVAGVGLCAGVSERLRGGSGRIAAFLLVSTPLSAGYLGYEYLELPILTYLLAAMLSILRGPDGRGWTVLACAFAGLGISVKPTAFSLAVLVPAAVAMMIVRDRSRRSVAAAIASFATFGLTAGFWSLWNFAVTGWPVYRYPGTTLDPEAGLSYGSIWIALAKYLGLLATTGLYWPDSAGPFLWAGLAGFVLFLRGKERSPAALLLVSSLALYGVGVILAPHQLLSAFGVRYFSPCLIGFGVPVAAQFVAWARERPGLLRTAVLTALILPSIPLLLLKGGKGAVAAPAALGFESRSAYLSKKIETFVACETLNALPAPKVKVLFAAIRPYYLDHPFVWIPYTGGVPFLRGVGSRDEFIQRVRREGITHVIYEPARGRDPRFNDPDVLFAPPFREVGRWPWKKDQWVRLYELEGP
jgi:hypothetical protein